MNKTTVFFIISFVLATHISYISNGFTWMDHNDIEQKRAVLPIGQVYKAFFIPFGETSFYRPVVMIVNSIDYALYGKDAGGFHMTNILLHIMVVVVSVKFMTIFFDFNEKEKFIGALIVGVHPAAIFIAGSITQRQEALMLIFIMLAVIFYARASLWSVVCWAAAILTKETAVVVLPALLIFWELVKSEKNKKTVWLWVGMAGVLVLYGVMRYQAVPKLWNIPPVRLSLEEAVGTRIGLLGKFGLALISPVKPGFSDAVPVLKLRDMRVFGTGVVAAALVYLVVRRGLRDDFSKGIILTGILLAPALNIVPVPRIGSPHYLYLAVAGVVGVGVWVFRKLPWLVWGWIAVAAAVTFWSGFQFKNDTTYFKPEVEKDPNFAEGRYYLGNEYLAKGDFESAESEYRQGLDEKPGILVYANRLPMQINLGTAFLGQEKLDEAEKYYDLAYKNAMEDLKPYIRYNLALVAKKREDYWKVVDLLEGGSWDTPEPYLLLNEAYRNLGKLDKVR